MRTGSWTLTGLAAFGLWACSATSVRDDDAPSAGNAGSASGVSGNGAGNGSAGIGSGSAGIGSAGTSGGGGGSGAGTACQQLERASSEVIAEVLQTVDLSCASDDECEYASNSTDCHASCGALVGPLGKAELEAAIADENAGRCADFEDMGCVTFAPPCVPPPPGIRCQAGRCTSDDEEPSGNAGSGADAGMPVDGCLDQPLTFGWNGGFVAFSDVITISPCRAFAVERTAGRGGPSLEGSCENEIAAGAMISADAIDAALAEPAVQAAFAAAPKLFGEDSRPVDGSVYSIELGGKTIEVGGECGGGGGLGGPCVEIPPELSELVTALQALVEQQMALPDCDQLS